MKVDDNPIRSWSPRPSPRLCSDVTNLVADHLERLPLTAKTTSRDFRRAVGDDGTDEADQSAAVGDHRMPAAATRRCRCCAAKAAPTGYCTWEPSTVRRRGDRGR
jgi:hypothetical protein